MSKNRKTPRFDVDYKQRLEQSRTASDAVRMPRLGYSKYRVYDIEKSRGVSKGILNGIYGSSNTGKSSYNVTRQYNNGNWQKLMWAFIDEIESFSQPAYDVRWLKPKHVTLLKLKGHRVEPAQPGDKSNKIQGKSGPVRLGV